MARKKVVTKDFIIDGAFEITRKKGFQFVNARSIASYLNISTQPIYTSFSDMEELKIEVMKRANLEYNKYLLKIGNDIQRYRELGINYIRFAREESHLFRLLFMTKRCDNSIYDIRLDDNEEYIISLIESYRDMDKHEAQKIYRMMWIYAHGIATMIVNEIATFTNEEIENLLSSIFIPLIKKA